jgi:predicted ATPase with chaperone activity
LGNPVGERAGADLDPGRRKCLVELAFSGEVQAVRGELPGALSARIAGRILMAPRANADEALPG